MVTVQDIGLQLTKPAKELAKWHFPLAQTLEKYCSLFNTSCNQSFSEAGLVLQNSTAAYVHRVDSLWTKADYSRNVLSTHEQEEATKSPTKKRDRKTDADFHQFKTVNFEEEVDKNIKKNHVAHDSVKSKSRRFTQLEKGITEHVSIDIYDVNGEVVGKKYDFRCNQNINADGILVDEFAPQDFYCDDVSAKEKSSPNCSYGLSDTSALNSTVHDNNEDVNSDAESNGDCDSPEEEISRLDTSLEASQQSITLSGDTEADSMLVETPTNISSDNSCHVTLNTSSETCPDTPTDTNSPIISNIDSTVLNNNDSEDQCLNNIRESIDVGSLLDSPPESVNSKGRRTSSTDDPALLNDTNGDCAKALTKSEQNTPLNNSKRNKMEKKQQRSPLKSTSKTLKRKLVASEGNRGRQSKRKRNLLRSVEHLYYSGEDRPNMFKENLRTCMKCIREYNPLQYKDVTNAELDFLGFKLSDDTKSKAHINDDVTTSSKDDVTTSSKDNLSTSIDDGISNSRSPSPVDMSTPRESFCDVWFQSDSPQSVSENVDKWHEIIQPKLCDAERRSTFCIRDYASRIVETLKTSGQRRTSFDSIVQQEHPCEVARYFLASLDLASKYNVDINTNGDSKNDIEIVLRDEDRQCSTSQADSDD
ncbi:PREDICTED: dentin sialophosphoprotein-like [Vollenhovia emeryi]|uniref:dentin sialophosphoprotein-like n=1 Tax=Vollenhovia emeryi TaxID=411798 RepID=UPI0005F4F9D7|nr:PREDICTED: dentin sialophosphoprotein-like [Vollenhovia emeryi]